VAEAAGVAGVVAPDQVRQPAVAADSELRTHHNETQQECAAGHGGTFLPLSAATPE